MGLRPPELADVISRDCFSDQSSCRRSGHSLNDASTVYSEDDGRWHKRVANPSLPSLSLDHVMRFYEFQIVADGFIVSTIKIASSRKYHLFSISLPRPFSGDRWLRLSEHRQSHHFRLFVPFSRFLHITGLDPILSLRRTLFRHRLFVIRYLM